MKEIEFINQIFLEDGERVDDDYIQNVYHIDQSKTNFLLKNMGNINDMIYDSPLG